jgi:hypothetical protein
MNRLRPLLCAVTTAVVVLALPGAAPASPGILRAPFPVHADHPIENSFGQFRLVLRHNGNLELLDQAGRMLWQSHSHGHGGTPILFMRSGELVVYESAFGELFTTNTGGHPDGELRVQDDGNVVIYTRDGRPIWATHTVYHTLEAPSHLDPMQNLSSPNGRYRLRLGGDGNLVIYDEHAGRPIWATHTAGCGGDNGARAALQNNGRLVVATKAGHACWANYPGYHGNAKVTLGNDGVLAESSFGHVFWSTESNGGPV